MYYLFNGLLIVFTFFGCNQKSLIIDKKNYKVEIFNFDSKNFANSKSALGSELEIFRSEYDSVTILIDYALSFNDITNYFSEDRFMKSFDNLKYQQIKFLITLESKVIKNRFTSETIVFREWSRAGLSDYQKYYEYIYSEITDITSAI